MNEAANNLIWIDLEMTGLDTDRDLIIEIATIVTDAALQIVAEGPVLAIYQDNKVLDAMDDWNIRHHSKSGLLARVASSTIRADDAQRETLDFLDRHTQPGKSPMCGNSICQDRRFLHRLMPELEEYFHYRNLDVSTIKELVTRWAPQHRAPEKQSKHLALDDIQESIAELRYYREHVFRI